MWRDYFADKNYRVFYLHTFGDRVATKLTEIFTAVYFYSIGMPLHFIFLFWGLEFGLRGVLAPLGPKLFSKLGATKTIAISYVSLFIYFVMVGSAPFSLKLAFFAFVFHSLAKAIYYPCIDALHAVLVKDGERGRQNSLELALAVLAGLVAVGLGTLILSHYPFMVLAGVVAILLVLSGWAASRLSTYSQPGMSFQDSYTFLASKEFRPYIVPFAAYSLAIIANIFVAPLFIFIYIGEIETFGAVIAATLTVELLVIIVAGRAVDLWKRKHLASAIVALQSIGNIGFLFIGNNPLQAFFVNAYNSNVWNAMRNTFETRVQSEANRSRKAFLFMASTQMTLCFMEIIALVVFAFVAFLNPGIVFFCVFASSIVGLIIAERTFFGR